MNLTGRLANCHYTQGDALGITILTAVASAFSVQSCRG